MQKNIWFRILPIDLEECDHLSCALATDLESILPVLFSLGLVYMMSGKLQIMKKQWSELYNQCNGFFIFKLHFGFSHPKGGLKSWFVCIGNPAYNVPGKEVKACMSGRFSYTFLAYTSRQDLLQKISDYCLISYVLIFYKEIST